MDIQDRYATLSYSWGTSPRGPHTSDDTLGDYKMHGIALTNLSQTIQDAILVASTLSIRYLWVDRFCIIQDDNEDWEKEAKSMCHIYEHSSRIISADGSKGVTWVYSKIMHILAL